jgi:hypothetical protein
MQKNKRKGSSIIYAVAESGFVTWERAGLIYRKLMNKQTKKVKKV